MITYNITITEKEDTTEVYRVMNWATATDLEKYVADRLKRAINKEIACMEDGTSKKSFWTRYPTWVYLVAPGVAGFALTWVLLTLLGY